MKKILALFTLSLLLAACSQDNELIQQTDASAKLVLNLDELDDSNLGLYRGMFSTMNSSQRGTIDLEIKEGVASRASLTLVNGIEYKFASTEIISEDTNIDQALFVSNGASFKFSVNRDGSDPRFTDVIFLGEDASLKVLKETSRSAVTVQTGTWQCTTGCSGSGTWNLTYNTGDGSGDYTTGGDLVTQIIFNGTDIGTSSNSQNSCSDDGNVTTCDIVGSTLPVAAAGGSIVIWGGQHKFLSAASPACSEASGTWTSSSLNGTWISDTVCFNQGNYSFDPVLLIVNAEGTGCVSPGDVGIDISDLTDSGVSSSCGNGTADVWYSFVASTNALTVSVQLGSGASLPSFTVYDENTLSEVSCNGGGLSGDFTISGLTPADLYLLRVSANEDLTFCIEYLNE